MRHRPDEYRAQGKDAFAPVLRKKRGRGFFHGEFAVRAMSARGKNRAPSFFAPPFVVFERCFEHSVSGKKAKRR